jgi:hypothetical protein
MQLTTGALPIAALALSPFLAFAVQPLAAVSFSAGAAESASEIRLLSPPGRAAAGNVAVLEQGDGLVVIDGGGGTDEGRRAVRFIRSVSDKPVKTVVLASNTRAAGVAVIRQAWPGAQVVAAGRGRVGLFGATPS